MKTSKLHLSPYGTFDHPEGQQSVSFDDAQRCIRQTRTWRFRLGLKKIPVYIGHPDDPLFQKEHSDNRIYGYVKDLCADAGGLWAFVKWTKDGRTFLSKSPQQYLSPRWVLCKTENQTAYHPERLLSVGLTQHPNLPVQPIELPKPTFELRRLPKRFIGNRFFMKKRTIPEFPCSALVFRGGFKRCMNALHRIRLYFTQSLRAPFGKNIGRSKAQTSSCSVGSSSAEVANNSCTRRLLNKLRRFFTRKQNHLINAGVASQNPPASSDEGSFPGHRTPLSSDLRGAQTREEKRRILQFGQAVRARMKATGESYPEAWNVVFHQSPAVPADGHRNIRESELSARTDEPSHSTKNTFFPQALKPMTVAARK